MAEKIEGEYTDIDGEQNTAEPEGNYTEVDEGDGVTAGSTEGESSYTGGEAEGEGSYTDTEG